MGVVTGGGGGGGGPAAGSYWPVANKSGVTVDTTTYPDTIKGGGAKLTTLVFPASEQGSLAVALSGDAFPRVVLSSDVATSGWCFGDGSLDPPQAGPGLSASSAVLRLGGNADGISLQKVTTTQAATAAAHVPRTDQLSPRFTITSGALPTVQLVSGAGAQILTGRDAETHTPVTFNPGVATTATVTVALSPDNATYSTLAVVTKPVGTVFDGEIDDVTVRVPAGWYLKLTVNAQAALGLTTYY